MVNIDSETVSRDQAFDILSNPRRRYVLHYLSSHPEGVTLQTLAEEIAAWENDTTVEDLSKKQQKRVYVSLYQTHIPKLEEVGIVEYDDETSMITLTSRADSVTSYLERDYTGGDQWYLYYLALVVVGGVVFAATAWDISVFASLSTTVVGLAIIGSFAVLTVAYLMLRYRSARDYVENFRFLE